MYGYRDNNIKFTLPFIILYFVEITVWLRNNLCNQRFMLDLVNFNRNLLSIVRRCKLAFQTNMSMLSAVHKFIKNNNTRFINCLYIIILYSLHDLLIVLLKGKGPVKCMNLIVHYPFDLIKEMCSNN